MNKLYLFLIFTLIGFNFNAQDKNEEADWKSMIKSESNAHSKMLTFNVNPNTLNYDLKAQRLELQVDPSQQYITGTVTSKFVPNTAISSIYFDLATTMTVSSVKFHGNNLSFSQLATKELKIDFANALLANVLDSLSVSYAGAPDYSTGAFTADQQSDGTPVIYTLSEPYGAQEWFPTKQSMNDKIEKIQMIVTSPSQYSVASNGKLISETVSGSNKTTFWQTNYPIPAYLIAIGVTNYVKFNDVMGSPAFPFVNYVYPATAASSVDMANINWTKEIMPIYEQYFGPYPYRNEKYGHMEFGWGGGMEHATMTSTSSWANTLIAHELTHQWFGDKVTCGAWNDVWLNEGFATFGEHVAREKLLNTPEDFQSYLLSQKDYITSSPVGSVYVSDANLSNVNAIFDGRLSYSKGAYLLRMIKWILGDDVFYQALREYNSRPNLAYNYAKSTDFAASLQTSTGKDFTEFFNDWLYGQGYPTYQIKWNQTTDKVLRFKISQTQSNSSVSFFEMPLPIKVTGTSGEIAYLALNNTTNNQNFANQLNFDVASVQFNYEYQIIEKNSTVAKDASILATNEITKNKINIYPNPVKSDLNISGLNSKQNFQIYSINGKLVKKGETNSQTNINVSTLVKGVYILKLGDQNFKFIKE